MKSESPTHRYSQPCAVYRQLAGAATHKGHTQAEPTIGDLEAMLPSLKASAAGQAGSSLAQCAILLSCY